MSKKIKSSRSSKDKKDQASLISKEVLFKKGGLRGRRGPRGHKAL